MLYEVITYNDFLSTQNKVVRYVESDLTLSEDKILIDGIPGGPFHDGGRIEFGPDGKLRITSYNVCYTKLLRIKAFIASLLSLWE